MKRRRRANTIANRRDHHRREALRGHSERGAQTLSQCWIQQEHEGKSRARSLSCCARPASACFRLPSGMEELLHRVVDGFLHLGQMSGKEMIATLDDHEF